MKSSFVMKIVVLSLVSFLMLATVKIAWAQTTSTNWTGYAITSNGVTGISAKWTIPGIQCAIAGTENTISQGIAVWIGFDGLTNNGVPEQLGTMSYCWNGSPVYWSWEEDPTHGAGTTNHAITALYNEISAEEQITTSIAYSGNNRYQLSIKDTTTGDGRTFDVIISNTPRESAEWIVEAFTNINTGKEVTLPTFQPITFSDCSASVNNQAGSITQLNGEWINMVDSNNNTIATVQGLNQAGTSFSVAEVSPVPEFPNAVLALSTFFAVLVILRKRITRRLCSPL